MLLPIFPRVEICHNLFDATHQFITPLAAASAEWRQIRPIGVNSVPDGGENELCRCAVLLPSVQTAYRLSNSMNVDAAAENWGQQSGPSSLSPFTAGYSTSIAVIGFGEISPLAVGNEKRLRQGAKYAHASLRLISRLR